MPPTLSLAGEAIQKALFSGTEMQEDMCAIVQSKSLLLETLAQCFILGWSQKHSDKSRLSKLQASRREAGVQYRWAGKTVLPT